MRDRIARIVYGGLDLVSLYQEYIDNSAYYRGRILADESQIIESRDYYILFSREELSHIRDRHREPDKPGSIFLGGLDVKEIMLRIMNKFKPTYVRGRSVFWVGVDTGDLVGKMGIAWSDDLESVEGIVDYQLEDGNYEWVKVAPGERELTSKVSILTERVGKAPNGKLCLIMRTMFPGDMRINGRWIPLDRGLFNQYGFYYVVEEDTLRHLF